jgi:Spy/CpxP family protein refolding chaperone
LIVALEERSHEKNTFTHGGLLMIRNKFANALGVAAGLVFIYALPSVARAYDTPSDSVRTLSADRPATQLGADASQVNYFAGLTYTDDEKAAIDKIHQDIEARKEAVVKDQKLDEDQKSAMIAGYTRIENAQIYKVLTPEQQKQVREKANARRASNQAAQKKQPPRN